MLLQEFASLEMQPAGDGNQSTQISFSIDLLLFVALKASNILENN